MKDIVDWTAVDLFRNLSLDELTKVTGRLERRELNNGSIVFNEGNPGAELYIIEKGRVEVSLVRGDMVIVLAELGDYSFFGEMALVTEHSRSATVKVLEDTVVHILHKSDFVHLLEKQPAIATKLLLALAESLTNRILVTNANVETYFLINRAIVDNEQFRELYSVTHKKAPSSSG